MGKYDDDGGILLLQLVDKILIHKTKLTQVLQQPPRKNAQITAGYSIHTNGLASRIKIFSPEIFLLNGFSSCAYVLGFPAL